MQWAQSANYCRCSRAGSRYILQVMEKKLKHTFVAQYWCVMPSWGLYVQERKVKQCSSFYCECFVWLYDVWNGANEVNERKINTAKANKSSTFIGPFSCRISNLLSPSFSHVCSRHLLQRVEQFYGIPPNDILPFMRDFRLPPRGTWELDPWK